MASIELAALSMGMESTDSQLLYSTQLLVAMFFTQKNLIIELNGTAHIQCDFHLETQLLWLSLAIISV